MANNRMYIKCKICSAECFMMKYIDDWWCPNPEDGMGRIESFIDKHEHGENGSDYGPIHFELSFEVEDQFNEHGEIYRLGFDAGRRAAIMEAIDEPSS
jgi:hypothetical protein